MNVEGRVGGGGCLRVKNEGLNHSGPEKFEPPPSLRLLLVWSAVVSSAPGAPNQVRKRGK